MRIFQFFIIFLSVGCLLGFAFKDDPIKLTFLDVGYGDSILVELPNGKILLIDAGIEEAAPRIQSYLHTKKIKGIDLAVITHPHFNHFGGFVGLINSIPIKAFAINQDKRGDEGYDVLLNNIKEENIPVNELKAGHAINVGQDNILIEVLHPDYPTHSVNGNSLVLRIKYRWSEVILFSDIMNAQQEYLIEHIPRLKKADVVMLPHHGRDISDRFIEYFKRKDFVVSTGEYEKLPLDEQRLNLLDGDVYRTDQGNVVVIMTGWKTKVEYE